jgi:hypothetical protein
VHAGDHSTSDAITDGSMHDPDVLPDADPYREAEAHSDTGTYAGCDASPIGDACTDDIRSARDGRTDTDSDAHANTDAVTVSFVAESRSRSARPVRFRRHDRLCRVDLASLPVVATRPPLGVTQDAPLDRVERITTITRT